jgi:threonine dehydratase
MAMSDGGETPAGRIRDVNPWPITFEDVLAARERIRPHVPITPLRAYAALDETVGNGIRVRVKHENHQPTNAFKVRSNLSALTALPEAERSRGVVAATRGNHGLGLAWAGHMLQVPVTICVPHGNNPEKNRAILGYGAELVEAGRDWDETDETARRLVAERGLTMVHPINNRHIIAGAGTVTLEILEACRELDALVVAVGGGSQSVGALTAVRGLERQVEVFAVQAEGASAIHDSWHAGKPLSRPSAITIADGLATRNCYDFTFPPLLEGLTDFVTVTDGEIAEAVRILLATTHNLAEPAGAAGLAGLVKLRERLAGKTVAIILSGANIDAETLGRIVNREL